MRKFCRTYLSASMLLTFLAIILATCGGGGGDSGGSRGDLTGLSINGPSSMTEYGTIAYSATASWSDNSTSVVTPAWSVNSQATTINTDGVLSCSQIDSDQTVTITATYSSGGITETAMMDASITNVVTIPFTAAMLSGKNFYEENFTGGASNLEYFSFNADFTFGQSGYLTGTWSIDASGNLIEDIGGQGTVTVMLIADSSTEMQVLVDGEGGIPTIGILEKTVPVDPAKLPGTYRAQNGDVWTFNSDGTGSTSGGGGWSFSWSVDAGILKNIFSNGYQGWFHARASSQSTASAYTVLKVGFTEYNPSGVFYTYYGGRDLTRQ